MRSVALARLLAVGVAAACIACLDACGAGSQGSLIYATESYTFTVLAPPISLPHAREDIVYKVLVKDRKTRQPVQNGEGQIFANMKEGPRSWDGFKYGPEMGVYSGTLNYTLSGIWAVAIRFRRDSLHPLERADWMQDVLGDRDSSFGKRPPPESSRAK